MNGKSLEEYYFTWGTAFFSIPAPSNIPVLPWEEKKYKMLVRSQTRGKYTNLAHSKLPVSPKMEKKNLRSTYKAHNQAH